MRYAINSSKIKKDLKWKPNTNFVEGLKRHLIGTILIKVIIQV